MRKILELLDKIDDELEDAKEYAEDYLQHKAEGNIDLSNKYMEMSNDELKHASNIRDVAVEKIDELKRAFTLPAEMEDIWGKKHSRYVEKTAWIKQMLSM